MSMIARKNNTAIPLYFIYEFIKLMLKIVFYNPKLARLLAENITCVVICESIYSRSYNMYIEEYGVRKGQSWLFDDSGKTCPICGRSAAVLVGTK